MEVPRAHLSTLAGIIVNHSKTTYNNEVHQMFNDIISVQNFIRPKIISFLDFFYSLDLSLFFFFGYRKNIGYCVLMK